MASLDEVGREQVILTDLTQEGRVVVADLAERFGVSAVTVRKDLDRLERQGVLRRVRGGAVRVTGHDEGMFELRVRQSPEAKRAIARAIAPLVDHGSVIAMDSSTTCYHLAQELVRRRDLVVVTNGLRNAMLFMENSDATVLMPGGVLRRASGSVVGPIGDVLAGRGRIDHGFFGLVALSTVHGLMDLSAEEAQTKRFLADACRSVHGLFDSSKVDNFGLHSFARPDRITDLWTDRGVAADTVAEWAALGVPVNTVDVPGPSSARGAS